MPELPEVRVHAERLDRIFGAATLEGFDPITFTALKTATIDPLRAVGHSIESIGSRGKLFMLRLGEVSFVVHLMQGGRLTPDARMTARPRNGIARWRFVNHDALLLTEAGKERKAGIWVMVGDPLTQAPLAGLGPDADTVDRAGLTAMVGSTRVRVHGFLRDQRQLAGIGRRLANEICHTARISPFAITAKLGEDEIGRLHGAISTCVATSIDFERTQSEMVGSTKRPAEVHHRTGEPCGVCGDTIREIAYTTYTVNYCPTCQTGGRILADNTTSKFLK